MEYSSGNNGQSFRGHESPKTSVTTDNLVDFTQAQALRRTVKEVQQSTGLSKKQVENIRQGISGVSGTTLTRWIMGDADFAGDYAEWVGLVRPGEARTSAALTRLVNEVVQQQAKGAMGEI